MTTPNTDPDKGWVRVEDAWPEDHVEVIVFTTNRNQWFAFREAGEWWDEMGHPLGHWPSVITHWRNPPAPPKEGE